MEAPVLIPRPETEVSVSQPCSSECVWLFDAPQQLVGHVLQSISMLNRPAPRFLDIGCGSGAVSLAILSEHPTASGVAIDINPAAVRLTAKNAKRRVHLCISKSHIIV